MPLMKHRYPSDKFKLNSRSGDLASYYQDLGMKRGDWYTSHKEFEVEWDNQVIQFRLDHYNEYYLLYKATNADMNLVIYHED